MIFSFLCAFSKKEERSLKTQKSFILSLLVQKLLNTKHGTKAKLGQAVIRTATKTINNRIINPMKFVIATAKNATRTPITFLRPFIHITCKVVDIISTTFFSTSSFHYFFGIFFQYFRLVHRFYLSGAF